MALKWSDYEAIVDALAHRWPDIDRISLSHADLTRMIKDLPEFDDTPEPANSNVLDHILWCWMRSVEDIVQDAAYEE